MAAAACIEPSANLNGPLESDNRVLGGYRTYDRSVNQDETQDDKEGVPLDLHHLSMRLGSARVCRRG